MTPSISALELQQIDAPFDHPDWIFEIKFDGFRSLAAIENGEDLSDLPLLERKKRLRSIVRKNASRVFYVDDVVGLGKALFAEVCKRDMEGIVAKLAISPYKAVRRASPWTKIKNPNYTQKEGRGEMFNRRR